MSSKISPFKLFSKRLFDFIFASILLVLSFPIVFVSFVVACIETRSFGIFFQKRIGLHGRAFNIFKIKTLKNPSTKKMSSITSLESHRMTKSGKFFRKYKIDELPQLFNVLIGDMSFVGPRPDVSGYADKLEGEDKLFLSIRPGITGPASIKYSDEESILDSVEDPQKYNDEVIWPDKVKINIQYINSYSFVSDLKYIIKTVWK